MASLLLPAMQPDDDRGRTVLHVATAHPKPWTDEERREWRALAAKGWRRKMPPAEALRDSGVGVPSPAGPASDSAPRPSVTHAPKAAEHCANCPRAPCAAPFACGHLVLCRQCADALPSMSAAQLADVQRALCAQCVKPAPDRRSDEP